jgi:hypothetical protein
VSGGIVADMAKAVKSGINDIFIYYNAKRLINQYQLLLIRRKIETLPLPRGAMPTALRGHVLESLAECRSRKSSCQHPAMHLSR